MESLITSTSATGELAICRNTLRNICGDVSAEQFQVYRKEVDMKKETQREGWADTRVDKNESMVTQSLIENSDSTPIQGVEISSDEISPQSEKLHCLKQKW